MTPEDAVAFWKAMENWKLSTPFYINNLMVNVEQVALYMFEAGMKWARKQPEG